MRQNYSGAAAYFRRAADKGDRDGLTNLAVCYDNGWVEGHPPDKVWTIKMYCFWISKLILYHVLDSFINAGRCPNKQNFRNFWCKKFSKFPGKVPGNSKNCWISEMWPVNGKSEKKGKWNGNFRKFGLPREVVLFFGNCGKCCSVPYWNCPKIQTGIFGRLESHTSHHLQLRCGNEDSVQCKTTYLDSGIRILFNSLWQRAAFKYWFEAATKGHPGSCLAVGEGVSSGLYVDRNCPLGVV